MSSPVVAAIEEKVNQSAEHSYRRFAQYITENCARHSR